MNAVVDGARTSEEQDAGVGVLPLKRHQFAGVKCKQSTPSGNSEQRDLALVVDQLAVRRQEVRQNALLFHSVAESKVGVYSGKPARLEFDVEARSKDATASKPVAQLSERRTSNTMHMNVWREERAVTHGTLTPCRRTRCGKQQNQGGENGRSHRCLQVTNAVLAFLNHWEDNRVGPGYF